MDYIKDDVLLNWKISVQWEAQIIGTMSSDEEVSKALEW